MRVRGESNNGFLDWVWLFLEDKIMMQYSGENQTGPDDQEISRSLCTLHGRIIKWEVRAAELVWNSWADNGFILESILPTVGG